MPLAQISPNSVNANPVHVNPQVKADQATAVPQVSQDVQKTITAAKTDTVAISPYAVKMLARDGDTAVVEAKETAADKASEKSRGKK